MLEFQQGSLAAAGIPAGAIEKLKELFAKRRVRIHGYLLLRGKEILAENYFAPYRKGDLHRMYSVTKSMVALAVGLLCKDGLISLEDKICQHFPEMLPTCGAHPWCAEMTIRDMLTMRTCYASTTYKSYPGKDWAESFFRTEPDHVPGTVFSYDTSAAHVLCALTEKLTGMKMLDYMRRKMLDELGFSKEAYIIPDPVGVSQGGSGMLCTLEDVARVAYLCSHYGTVDGKEYLPEQFVREAVAAWVPTDLQPKLDEQCGYGYFIWRCREEGFAFYGLGGQLALCFPRYDVIFLTMADTMGSPAGVQILHDCFYEAVYPWVCGDGAEGQADAAHTDQTAHTQVCVTQMRATQGRVYQFYPNAMGWKQVVFDWEQGQMHFRIPAGDFTLSFSEGEWRRQAFLDSGCQCECRGMWKWGHFILECFLISEELGNVRMDFAWKDERLSVHSVSALEPVFKRLQDCLQGFASAHI